MPDHENAATRSFFFWLISRIEARDPVPEKTNSQAVCGGVARFPFFFSPPFPQSSGQRFCINWISQRNHAYRYQSFRNAKAPPGRHLRETQPFVCRESSGCTWKMDSRWALSAIVETVSIGGPFMSDAWRERKNQHRSVPAHARLNPQDPDKRLHRSSVVLRATRNAKVLFKRAGAQRAASST